jgi:hypothetical protein
MVLGQHICIGRDGWQKALHSLTLIVVLIGLFD